MAAKMTTEPKVIALRMVKEFAEREGWPPKVIFVLFSSRDLEVYEQAAKEMAERAPS